MHADVNAVSVKREADGVTECSHDDLSTTTTGEFAAVSRLCCVFCSTSSDERFLSVMSSDSTSSSL